MIKIENVVVSGWKAAIRGMRNPMNSWMKSDSHVCTEETANDCICPMVESGHSPCVCNDGKCGYCIGVNDMALMQKLAAAGSVQRNMIPTKSGRWRIPVPPCTKSMRRSLT